MGDPNNIIRTVDGAVYARYTGDDAVYAAASGPRLTIRIASANHFARMAEAVEDKYDSAAAKKASSKGKKKKRATTT